MVVAVAMAVVAAAAVTAPEENEETQRGRTRVASERERDGMNEPRVGKRERRKSEQRGSYVRFTNVEGI